MQSEMNKCASSCGDFGCWGKDRRFCLDIVCTKGSAKVSRFQQIDFFTKNKIHLDICIDNINRLSSSEVITII